MKIQTLVQMAGDHGSHLPGSEINVPVNVARQLVARCQAVALEPIPDPEDDEVIPDDLKGSLKKGTKAK